MLAVSPQISSGVMILTVYASGTNLLQWHQHSYQAAPWTHARSWGSMAGMLCSSAGVSCGLSAEEYIEGYRSWIKGKTVLQPACTTIWLAASASLTTPFGTPIMSHSGQPENYLIKPEIPQHAKSLHVVIAIRQQFELHIWHKLVCCMLDTIFEHVKETYRVVLPWHYQGI